MHEFEIHKMLLSTYHSEMQWMVDCVLRLKACEVCLTPKFRALLEENICFHGFKYKIDGVLATVFCKSDGGLFLYVSVV